MAWVTSARTPCITAVLLSALVGFGFAQTVLSSALQDLTRYYRSAAEFTASVVSGVNNVKPADIPQADREKVVRELNGISYEISSLRAMQAPLVFDLSSYIDDLRAGKLSGDKREKAWRSILDRGRSVLSAVVSTEEIVESSRWINVTVGSENFLAFREVLRGRAVFLGNLLSLPAPSTRDEIDELERMNKYYQQLIKSLGDLNSALNGKIEQLRSER